MTEVLPWHFDSHDEEADRMPLRVIDVGGHNVAIYAVPETWRDPKGTLSPSLQIRVLVADMPATEETWPIRQQIMNTVYNLIESKIGAANIIQYSNDGMVVRPKSVEHLEKSAEETAEADSHPAFFEAREQIRGDMMKVVRQVRDQISDIGTTPSDAEFLQADPPASEQVKASAREALLRSKGMWLEMRERKEKKADGHEYWFPPYVQGIVTMSTSKTDPHAADKLVHGVRTIFAEAGLDIGVMEHRKLYDGDAWILRATPESYKVLIPLMNGWSEGQKKQD